MKRAASLALVTALSCASLSCAARTYDPGRDRKIPQPPKWLTWSHAQIINASPEVVWSTYVDFASYPQWNPFILEAIPRAPGEVGISSVVDIEVQLGPKTREMWHKIYEFQAPSGQTPGRFCWRDGGAATAFVQGARCRTIRSNPDGTTTFTQYLMVSGVARGAALRRYDEILTAALIEETSALVKRVRSVEHAELSSIVEHHQRSERELAKLD